MIFNLVGYQLLLGYWEIQKQKALLAQMEEKEDPTPEQHAMSAREEFTRLVDEFQKKATERTSEQNNSVTVKFSFSDYTVQQSTESRTIVEVVSTKFYSSAVNILPSPEAASPGQPPDFTVL